MKYTEILKSEFYKETYEKIAELKKDFAVDHSFLHIQHVIKNAKKLSKTFNLSNKQKNLLYIACCLHDIGYLEGRENHAQNGSLIAREFLKKHNIKECDIDVICSAIANHGGKEEKDFYDKVSLCLTIADKLDFIGSRYNEKLMTVEKAKNFKNIISNDLSLQNNSLILKIFVTSNFDSKKFEEEYFGVKLFNFLNLVCKTLNYNNKVEYIVI